MTTLTNRTGTCDSVGSAATETIGTGALLPVHERLQWRWRLRPGVFRVRDRDRDLLTAWPASLVLGDLSTEQEALLGHLSVGWCTAGRPDEGDGPGDGLVRRLLEGGWLHLRAVLDGDPVLTVAPRRPVPPPPTAARGPLRLRASRFAVVHQGDDGLRLELPHSWGDGTVEDLDVLHALWNPTTDGSAAPLCDVLLWLGALESDEEEEFRTRQWATHELWFHERTRRYARSRDFGGTYWARGRHDPLPADPVDDRCAPTLPLVATAPRRPGAAGGDVRRVMEDRRSYRRHDDDNPLTVAEVGEFLHRTARERMRHEVDGVEHLSRPHPSGGSLYELDLHLLVRNVSGLRPGLHHYHPADHSLGRLPDADPAALNALLREAAHSSTVDSRPQLVVLMSARVGRLLWKYQEMGYAVVLKHVGVLMQSMYLVATDMGLAPCAVGSGDSDLFSRATGADPLTDVTVGEFLLGSRSAAAEPFTPRPS